MTFVLMVGPFLNPFFCRVTPNVCDFAAETQKVINNLTKQMGKGTEGRRDRETERQRYKETERRKDGETERHRERDREREVLSKGGAPPFQLHR